MEIRIEQMIWESLVRRRGRPAIVWTDPASGQEHEWSYADLVFKIRTLIQILEETTSNPKSPILIMAEKSGSTYALILACTLSGRPFIPLSPRTPAARLQEIAAQFPSILIAFDSCFSMNDRKHFSNATQPHLNLESLRQSKAFDDSWSPQDQPSEDPAYIIFTSGSTGKPKGIVVLRRNLTAFLKSSQALWAFSEQDRFSQVYELSFDPSLADIFWCFTCGGTLFPLSSLNMRGISQFLSRNEITVFGCSPSYLLLAYRTGSIKPEVQFPSIRMSAFIGEKLTWDLADRWSRNAVSSMIENHYGPAEVTISVSRYQVDLRNRPETDSVPIGQPHPLHEFQRVREDLSLCHASETGELVIAGPQVSAGYWNDPVRTTEAFRTFEWDANQSRIWYRTGDQVSSKSFTGETPVFIFERRHDRQVKLNGQRIELGEIESQLSKLLGASSVLGIFLVPLGGSEKEIHSGTSVLAVLSSPLDSSLIESACRTLSLHLAPAAVPASFHWIDDIPLSANGKLDRVALYTFVSSGKSRQFWPESASGSR